MEDDEVRTETFEERVRVHVRAMQAHTFRELRAKKDALDHDHGPEDEAYREALDQMLRNAYRD